MLRLLSVARILGLCTRSVDMHLRRSGKVSRGCLATIYRVQSLLSFLPFLSTSVGGNPRSQSFPHRFVSSFVLLFGSLAPFRFDSTHSPSLVRPHPFWAFPPDVELPLQHCSSLPPTPHPRLRLLRLAPIALLPLSSIPHLLPWQSCDHY